MIDNELYCSDTRGNVMERFDSEKGLIHLVFANHEDTYYLDSLVKLNLWQYLYSQLRQQGYKGIYFIREMRIIVL